MSTKSKTITPQPRQNRAKGTVESAIAATRQALQSGGEGAVRIQEISKQTGVSIGSLYHHFGDRAGLIHATYIDNFERTTQAEVEIIRAVVESTQTSEDLRNHRDDLEQLMAQMQSREASIERATMLGQVVAKPQLRDALAEAQERVTNSFTEVMQILRDRGMLKEHITPRTAAILLQVLLFGRIIAELESNPVENEEWNRAVLTALGGLIRFD